MRGKVIKRARVFEGKCEPLFLTVAQEVGFQGGFTKIQIIFLAERKAFEAFFGAGPETLMNCGSSSRQRSKKKSWQ